MIHRRRAKSMKNPNLLHRYDPPIDLCCEVSTDQFLFVLRSSGVVTNLCCTRRAKKEVPKLGFPSEMFLRDVRGESPVNPQVMAQTVDRRLSINNFTRRMLTVTDLFGLAPPVPARTAP